LINTGAALFWVSLPLRTLCTATFAKIAAPPVAAALAAMIVSAEMQNGHIEDLGMSGAFYKYQLVGML